MSKGVKMNCRKAEKNISLALDGRLSTAMQEELQAHLRDCPSCREWNRRQLRLLQQIQAREMIQPSPGFLAALQNKVGQAAARPQLFLFHPAAFRPLLLRAAMLLVLVFSALLGYYLGGSPDSPAVNADAEVFSQTLNLNAFSDLPADSYGAVYGRLLQGDPQ
jgi:predicted anti-sigma-YlaC factor YlaD